MIILSVDDISKFHVEVRKKEDVYDIIIWEHRCPVTEDNKLGKECWIFFVSEDMKTVFERDRPKGFGRERKVNGDTEDVCYVFAGDRKIVNRGFKKIGYDINPMTSFAK